MTYTVEKLLGAGGMAEVYLGRSVGADGFTRPVAIKRVRTAYANDKSFVEAFAQEALLAAKLSHPNIVSVVDYQRDENGVPFLVMEYVDGKDLSALAATGPLPCSVAVHIVCEMLRGLAYAHQLPTSAGIRGVVHRDVSPHNVLLSWKGEVKVSDFGIAKAFTTSRGAFSATVKGKPCYMSPEQIGSEVLDGRSDLFSVGVVFWELLTGRRVFEALTYQETLMKVVYSPIPKLADEVPEKLDPDVEVVVMKLLARDKSERYATAQEAVADLLRCEVAPRDGVGLLAALIRERLLGQGGELAAKAPIGGAAWPGPLVVRTLTQTPANRRTKTLDAPAAPFAELGALVAGARVSTGPNDLTLTPAGVSGGHLPAVTPMKVRWPYALLGIAILAALGTTLLVVSPRSTPAQAGPAQSPTPTARSSAPRTSPSGNQTNEAGTTTATVRLPQEHGAPASNLVQQPGPPLTREPNQRTRRARAAVAPTGAAPSPTPSGFVEVDLGPKK